MPDPTLFDAAASTALGEPQPGKSGKEPRRHAKTPRVAFDWVDETMVAQTALAPRDLSAAANPYVTVDADLLARAPRRSPFRAGVLVPIAIIAALIGGYSGTTLLWPLHAVAPEIEAVQVDSAPAPATALAWPAEGSGAVSVTGFDGTLASTQDAAPIASITKVVTALLVLEELPLAVGEQGAEYRFTAADRTRYWGYRSRGESALDVPVGGTLTEYQLLEGMLIGSANNYADRLASILWPSDAVYASAARTWLEVHGVPGVTIVEPTGFDSRNAASAASLITLAQKALANPVIAEIVAKSATDLPGAGHVENTNGLLADAGVIGVKTGSLDDFNLLAAKNISIGGTPVRLYAAVLGQEDDDGAHRRDAGAFRPARAGAAASTLGHRGHHRRRDRHRVGRARGGADGCRCLGRALERRDRHRRVRSLARRRPRGGRHRRHAQRHGPARHDDRRREPRGRHRAALGVVAADPPSRALRSRGLTPADAIPTPPTRAARRAAGASARRTPRCPRPRARP